MNDGQVLDAVAVAKRSYKRAEAAATRKFQTVTDKAEAFFNGRDDVERAAKHNAIKRAEAEYEVAVNRARITLIDRLESLRERAGEWADLVPRVR